MSEAENRVAWDGWLARSIGQNMLGPPMVADLSSLGRGYDVKPAKRRYRPRGTWKKLRRCKCR